MKPLITRIALLILAAEAAAIAVPALVAPRAFYDSFPLGASWVAMLPPFNQHLISDGGRTPAPADRPAVHRLGDRCARALRLPRHTLDGWDAADAIAQTVSLALVLALPLIAAAAAPHEPH
jgi:hypothetical protein